MKFFAIKSKTKTWTNQRGRAALGINQYEQVEIRSESNVIQRSVSKAPRNALGTMKAAFNQFGYHGIAMTQTDLNLLAIESGEMVEVVDVNKRQIETPTPKQVAAPQKQLASSSTTSKSAGVSKLSLKERIAAMELDQVIEVSESAAKSGAYSVAKELGMSVKKVTATSIKRVS